MSAKQSSTREVKESAQIDFSEQESKVFSTLKSADDRAEFLLTRLEKGLANRTLGKTLTNATGNQTAAVYEIIDHEGEAREVLKFRFDSNKNANDADSSTATLSLNGDYQTLKANLPNVSQLRAVVKDTFGNTAAVVADFVHGTTLPKAIASGLISRSQAEEKLLSNLLDWKNSSSFKAFHLCDDNPDNFLVSANGDIILIDPDALSNRNCYQQIDSVAEPCSLDESCTQADLDDLGLTFEDLSFGDFSLDDFYEVDRQIEKENTASRMLSDKEIVDRVLGQVDSWLSEQKSARAA